MNHSSLSTITEPVSTANQEKDPWPKYFSNHLSLKNLEKWLYQSKIHSIENFHNLVFTKLIHNMISSVSQKLKDKTGKTFQMISMKWIWKKEFNLGLANNISWIISYGYVEEKWTQNSIWLRIDIFKKVYFIL